MDNERAEKFRTVVSQSSKPFTILVAQVDPDAIASAALTKLAIDELRDPELRETKIVYVGGIGHPQNRAVINRCNLKSILTPADEYEHDGGRWVLVDSSSIEDSRISDLSIESPAIVIDHHGESDLPTEAGGSFFEVDTSVGAAATLTIELIELLGIEIDQQLALLGALAIYTDTKQLIGASERDRDAYARVSEYITHEDMAGLINYSLPPSHYEHLKLALDDAVQKENRIVAGVGDIDEKDGDDLSSIADWLLLKQGVNTVVVWGIVNDSVRISARTDDISVSLDEFLQSRFGDRSGAKLTPDGRGEGGALINIDDIANNSLYIDTPEVNEERREYVRACIHAHVFQR